MAQLGKYHDTRAGDMDETLSLLITEELYIETQIDEFSEVLKLACNKSFPTYTATKKVTAHKTVLWWTQELTVLRKRTTQAISNNAGYIKEPGTMTNSGRSAKHNTPKVKQCTQELSKGKN
jgi:hypothetical protein